MSELRIELGGQRITVAPGAVVTIGREPDRDIRSDNPAVSRRHGEVQYDGVSWVYSDANSTGGTYQGGQRVTRVVLTGPAELWLGAPSEPGDRLRLEPVGVGGGGRAPLDRTVGPTPAGDTSLRLRFGVHDGVYSPGQVITVGRAPECDLTTDNPLVSGHHARILWSGGQWTLEDAGSKRGTYVGGRKVRSTRLGGAMTVWFGPPEAGEKLTVLTGGEAPRTPASVLRPSVVAGAALVLAAVAVLVVVFLGGGDDDELDVAALRRATVLVSEEASDPTSWGSGSIVSADGLVLTNAHVAAPAAPGRGVSQREPVSERNPARLYIYVVEDEDAPARPAYTAKVMAADGYLDFAVLQIDRTAAGDPVDRKKLKLPAVKLGDSRALKVDEDLLVLGFPGISETQSINVSRGVVSSFLVDERVAGPRSWINTDATISPGNSGGLAADHRGRLVGVPTLVVAERSGIPLTIGRLRPIHLAQPVIDAARRGIAYDQNKWVKQPTGDESFDYEGVLDTDAEQCEDRAFVGYRSGTPVINTQLRYSGMTEDQEVFFGLHQVRGTTLVLVDSVAARWEDSDAAGCLLVAFRNIGTGGVQRPFPDGTYKVLVQAGPNYETQLAEGDVDVGG